MWDQKCLRFRSNRVALIAQNYRQELGLAAERWASRRLPLLTLKAEYRYGGV